MFTLATRLSPSLGTKSSLPYLWQLHTLAGTDQHLPAFSPPSELVCFNKKVNGKIQHLSPKDIPQSHLFSAKIAFSPKPLLRETQMGHSPILTHYKFTFDDIEVSKPLAEGGQSKGFQRANFNIADQIDSPHAPTKTERMISEHIHSPVSLPKPTMFFMSSSADSSSSGDKSSKEPRKPNLEKVSSLLIIDLVNLFVSPMSKTLYHHNIIFEDNIRGKRYEGILEYRQIVNLMKIVCHFRFVYVRFNILSITEHPEDSTIRVRWRIVGMGMFKMLLKYIPEKMWVRGNMDKASATWYDGYSTFHVNSDDKIDKHRADKVMPDEDAVSVKKKLAEKLEKLQKLKPTPAPAI